MASPVKPTLNGSIPIGLTGVTKLCLSSVSFRRSTGVYKSDSIGSTGERNTVLTCQSTGVSSNQPASTICISSVQPAFRRISAEVSGELNRRNQPAFKPYASDRPALKKIAGPPVIYVSCPRCRPLFPFPSSRRRTPARLRSRQRRSPAAACPPCSRRFAPSLHAPHAILAAGQGRRHSACATTRARAHATPS